MSSSTVGSPQEIDKDFVSFDFEERGTRHSVRRLGSGPGVIILHEAFGLDAACEALGRRVAAEGFTTYLPVLMGRPAGNSRLREAGNFLAMCVSREIHLLAAGKTSPVCDWLRALGIRVNAECGGRGVGVVGMCMSGGFAIATAVEPAVKAVVASQPSLPMLRGRRSIGVSRDDMERVKERTKEGLRILGCRFSNDSWCPAQRFAALESEFGDAFDGRSIRSPDATWSIGKRAHAVLTREFSEQSGHPTNQAFTDVVEFLKVQLGAESG